MAEETAGLTPEQTADTVTSEQSAASGNAEQGANAPEKFVSVGEFNRKMSRMTEDNQRVLTMLQYIAAQQQAAPRPQAGVTPQGAERTDEQLWGDAQQGDRLAFEEYQRRIARREVQQTTQQQNYVSGVEAQIGALMQKYPVLSDTNHPLTQTYTQAYNVLVARGYAPGRATQLEAAKLAIADRPDLVSEIYGQGAASRERQRQQSVRSAQSGVTGVSYRNETPRREGAVRDVTQPEARLAARMLPLSDKHPNEKTYADRARGAKERFLKRQQDGLSSVNPVLAPVVERLSEEEGF